MLTKERIEELLRKVEQGNEAKELLKEHNRLIEQKEQLHKNKSLCTNCRRIRIEIAYNHYLEFEVNMPNYAVTQINKILDNEIEFIDTKLYNLS